MTALWFLHAWGEEVFFRGFLYNYLKKHFALWPAIGINGIIFSLLHLPSARGPFFSMFVASIAITAVYEYRRSILHAVVMHAVMNIVIYRSAYRQTFLHERFSTAFGISILHTLLAVSLAILALAAALSLRPALPIPGSSRYRG